MIIGISSESAGHSLRVNEIFAYFFIISRIFKYFACNAIKMPTPSLISAIE